jgi:uncharacterized membrane protein
MRKLAPGSQAAFASTAKRGLMVGLMVGLTAALLSACARTPSLPAPAEATAPTEAGPFIARGHEPGWQFQVLGDHAELQRFGDPAPMRMSITAIDSSADLIRLSVDSSLGALAIRIEHSLCRDSMSGLPYPDSVSIDLPERQLRGCGGDPHALLRAQPWRLANIEAAMPGDALLSFGESDQLQLHGPCNDYGGEYTLSGEGLRLRLTQSTRRSCAAGAGAEAAEHQLLERLTLVHRHDFGPAGELRLLGADGSYMSAAAAPTD